MLAGDCVPVSAVISVFCRLKYEFARGPFVSALYFLILVCKLYVATFLKVIFKAELINLLPCFRI